MDHFSSVHADSKEYKWTILLFGSDHANRDYMQNYKMKC